MSDFVIGQKMVYRRKAGAGVLKKTVCTLSQISDLWLTLKPLRGGPQFYVPHHLCALPGTNPNDKHLMPLPTEIPCCKRVIKKGTKFRFVRMINPFGPGYNSDMEQNLYDGSVLAATGPVTVYGSHQIDIVKSTEYWVYPPEGIVICDESAIIQAIEERLYDPFTANFLETKEEEKPEVTTPTPPLITLDDVLENKQGEEIKLTCCPSNGRLNQIYSSNQWSFSILGEGYKMLHEWVMCRDYLADVVRAELFKTSFNVYGLSHTGSGKIDVNNFLLGITHDDEKAFERLAVAREIVRMFEATMRIPVAKRSKIYRAEYQPDEHHTVRKAFVISVPAKWLLSPQLFSLYSLLWRLGDNVSPKELAGISTLKQLLKFIVESPNKNKNHSYISYLCRFRVVPGSSDTRFSTKPLTTLLRNTAKLFPADPQDSLFNPAQFCKSSYSFHGNHGVVSLFSQVANKLVSGVVERAYGPVRHVVEKLTEQEV